MTVWYKQGVTGDLSPETQKAKNTVAGVYRTVYGQDLFITSQREGTHGAGSLHYIGRAFDIRPPSVEMEGHTAIKEKLSSALHRDFDVVTESDHIHIEYDPK